MVMRLMQRIVDQDNLNAAWRAVRANQGGAGTDAVGLVEYEADLAANLAGLRARLREETYVPLPLRRASMPKRGGGERALAIPTVADRVAQRAFLQILEGVFEPLFLPCSFGYRPGRGVAQAVEAVLTHRAAGLPWVLDADVSDFFGSVDHGLLQARLRRHIGDRAVLRVLGLWLEAGVMAAPGAARRSLLSLAAGQVRSAAQAVLVGPEPFREDNFREDDFGRGRRPLPGLLLRFGAEAGRLAWDNRERLLPLLAVKGVLVGGGAGMAVLGAVALGQHVLAGHAPRGTGTPQGSPISPLLSNVYLHAFDERLTTLGLRLVRYADDFVICCASEARARQAQEIAATELSRLRLVLHPDKTRIVSCADPLYFLGHEFDRDGAFPVREEVPHPVTRAVRQGALAIRPALQQAAATAGQAARSGTGTARQAGATVRQEIADRWHEVRVGRQ